MLPALVAGQASTSPEASKRDWNATLGIDLGFLISPQSLLVLGVAGMAAAWSWEEVDEHHYAVQHYLDNSSLDPALEIGNVYGSGLVIGGGSLGVLAAGRIAGSENVSNFGLDLCRSYVYSSLLTGVLKHTIQRQRPSGGGLSFPSGHTTAAFSTVPVIWHHLGWQVGMGAGMLAVSTAMGRIEDNRHYLSDVLFGAAIGLAILI